MIAVEIDKKPHFNKEATTTKPTQISQHNDNIIHNLLHLFTILFEYIVIGESLSRLHV